MADEAEAEASGEKAGTISKGGAMGPLLGLVAVVVLAIGLAWVGAKALAPEPVMGDPDELGSELPGGPIWKDQIAIDLGEILANVKKEGGRRYVKVSVQVWVHMADQLDVSRPDVKPSLIAAIQDRLRSWTMDDYNRDNQAETMRTEFIKTLDKTLRDLTRTRDRERAFVTKVVFNYLVQ